MLCEISRTAQQLPYWGVLILVLMEDALRAAVAIKATDEMGSLNPCSNGRCSASISEVKLNNEDWES